ncbi:MAG: hypothetical protein JXA18_01220 [Chitinispirillaceae bacterium]|nr:hypothetical protein [Chitinispirillaceae bacterium]
MENRKLQRANASIRQRIPSVEKCRYRLSRIPLMAAFHDAPVFRCTDRPVLQRFCRRYGIADDGPKRRVIDRVARAFSALPYENLTKIIKREGVVGSRSAMRLPDEVLTDHLRWGTGGTCFSLTAAIIAVYGALGIEARPLLADRHYGVDTHCGLIVPHGEQMLLVDPGYLLFVPTPLPSIAISSVALGYTTIELRPIEDGRIELATVVKGSRKVRLTYKRKAVDAEAFVRAWIDSFTWEMMTYPVLNRCTAGEHFYLQGTLLSVRTAKKTVRTVLDPLERTAYIERSMGISRDIVLKAWGVINHGAA